MRGLDIVASMATLLKSCDRLSLYCTSKAHPLLVRSSPNLREVKIILDAIEHDTVKPKAGYLRRCIDLARRDTKDKEDLSNMHLLVLTCNPFALERVSPDEEIQLHVLSPGPLPWTYFKAYAIDGWLNLNQVFAHLDTPGTDPVERLDTGCLQKIVAQLRTSLPPDRIERLCITINPSSEDTIGEIMGSTFIESMNPGERRSILVRTEMSVERRRSSVLESFPIGLRTSSGQLDVERELKSMLDDRPLPQLKITIKYEHSALSIDTICEYTRDIFGRLQGDTAVSYNQASYEDSVVHQRLACYLASSQKNPGQALAELSSHLCANTNQSSNYTDALLQELKYQSRIQERYELSKDRILPVLQKYSLFPAPSSHRSLSVTSSSVKESPKVERQQSTSSIRLKNPKSRTDKASRLWSSMKGRRKSQGLPSQPHFNHIVDIGLKNENLQPLKNDTTQNGRIGVNRSPGNLYFEKGRENVAPWA